MSDIKQLRGQVRIVVKELLPEILKEQLYEDVKKQVAARLSEVEKYMRDTAELMNTRQKETLKYLLESYLAMPPKPEEKQDAPTSEIVTAE